MPGKTAILLTNLGTPERLERRAIRRFLQEFLSDPLVVGLPRVLWLPLLYGIILPLRSGKTLEAYSRVWRDDGSPLLHFSQQQCTALQQQLGARAQVGLAMRYGNPSFASVLKSMRDSGVEKLIVLPLYPQYSVTTTATTRQHLERTLHDLGYAPAVEFIEHYFEHPAYIAALAESVKQRGQQHLLMSFHGLPQVNIERGDPYQAQCQQTADLLAKELGLDAADWSICYQSRFGRQAWIQPYTSDVLRGLAERGITSVDVICPGFAADCLETLDEIDLEYRREYLALGGQRFDYIPALNDRASHIGMMAQLVEPYLSFPASAKSD